MANDRVRIKVTMEKGGVLPEAWIKQEGTFYREFLDLLTRHGFNIVEADISNPVRQMWVIEPSD